MDARHHGKQTKLSKTMGVPVRHNGRNNKFRLPSCTEQTVWKYRFYFLNLMNIKKSVKH